MEAFRRDNDDDDDPRVNGNYIVIPDISMMERVKEQKRHFT